MGTPKIKISRYLKRRILILDGATGTELQKAGMPAGVCPELWCLENPETVLNVHAAYCDAGSDIIYTTSFGANSYKLDQYGANDPVAINSGLAEIAREAAGVCMIGGCCGTNPEHIRRLAESVKSERPVKPARKSISAVSSARKTVVLAKDKPLAIVGERINPTGKKLLREALEKGLTDMSLIREMARDQERQGAGLLDINIGTVFLFKPNQV